MKYFKNGRLSMILQSLFVGVKGFVISVLCFVPFFSVAQGEEEAVKPLKNIVEVPGISKVELYNRAKKWTADNFRSSKDVIQLDDKENGKIIIRGLIVYNAPAFNPGTNYSGNFVFTFAFDCKDNKYKYEFHDAVYEPYNPGAWAQNLAKKKTMRKVLAAQDEELHRLQEDFERGMKVPYQRDDW